MADPTGILINIGIQLLLRVIMAALTPKQDTEGPRLEDRQLTTSTYGGIVPVGYGTTLLGGNIIWGRDIEERSETEEIGKGNAFSLGTNTTYTYYLTCAVAIAKRQSEALIRIYADGKIIYDAEGGTVIERMEGLSFRFYNGAADQPVNPIMASDYPSGECPAYRGTTYVVFDAMPLANFGNRVPQFRFVVAFASESQNPFFLQFPSDKSGNYDLVDYDERRRIVTMQEGSGAVGSTAPFRLRLLNSDSGDTLATLPLANLATAEFVGDGLMPYEGSFWASNSSRTLSSGDYPYIVLGAVGAGHFQFVVLEKDTLTLVGYSDQGGGSFGFNGFPCDNAYTWTYGPEEFGRLKHFISGGGGHAIIEVRFNTALKYFLASGSPGISFVSLYTQDKGVYGGSRFRGCVQVHRLPNLDPVFSNADGVYQDYAENFGCRRVSEGYKANKFTEFYVIQRKGTLLASDIRIVKHRVSYWGSVGEQVCLVNGGGSSLPGFKDSDDIHMQYDSENDILIVRGLDAGGSLSRTSAFRMNSSPDAEALMESDIDLLWSRTGLDRLLGAEENRDGNYVRVIGGEILTIRPGSNPADGEYDVIDTETGSTIRQYDIPDWIDQNGGTVNFVQYGIFDSINSRVMVVQAGDSVGWAYLDLPATRGSESLEDVVTDICLRSKLEAGDIDASDLSNIFVKGYAISRQVTYRKALEPLATAYNFYAVEKDGKLFFLSKDETVTLELDEGSFLSKDQGAAFEEMIVQPPELPRALYVEYRSSEFKDEMATQYARRIATPEEVVSSVGEITIQLPLVLSDQEAASLAERMMFESWVAREVFKFGLPQRHLSLLPNDVLLVTAQGRTEKIRIDRMSLGADLTLDIEGKTIGGDVYASAALAVSSIGSPNFTRKDVITDQYSRIVVGFVLDVPLLIDSTLSGRDQGALMLYVAGVPVYVPETSFNGAALLVSTNDDPFAVRGTIQNGMAWGLVIGNVPDSPGPNWNSVQEIDIDVAVYAGASYFTSVTQEDMIQSNANTFVFYEPSTNRIEVAAFRDAVSTITDDGLEIVRLTGFMRGKRGTNTLAESFIGPVYCIIMNSNWVGSFLEVNSKNDVEADYRFISAAGGADNTQIRTITYEHRSLMPYAPAHVEGSFDDPTSGDITISWVRRTRQGGSWDNYAGTVPLAEDSEEYQIDIHDGDGGVVLRTLTVTDDTEVVYTDEMIDEDFQTGRPSTFYVRVYQMSAQVGRGFSYQATLTEV